MIKLHVKMKMLLHISSIQNKKIMHLDPNVKNKNQTNKQLHFFYKWEVVLWIISHYIAKVHISYMTLAHKTTSYKGTFFYIIYTLSESRINTLSVDAWFGSIWQYLKNLRVQTSKYWKSCIHPQKLNFDIIMKGNSWNVTFT